jgi:hypothetical protein
MKVSADGGNRAAPRAGRQPSAASEKGILKLLLAVDVTTSAEEVVSAVAARPWPKGTVAHVLTAIEYAAIPSKVWRDAAGEIELVIITGYPKARIID